MAQQTLNPNSLLKDAREAKGITLEIVHEATKVPMDALKALEQGYSVKILTPFYYRGFIKIYAEFLGLNAQEVLTAYQMEKTVPKIIVPQQILKKIAPESNQSVGQPKQKPTKISQPNANPTLSPKLIQIFLGIVGFIFVIFIFAKLFVFIGTHIKFKAKPKSAVIMEIKEDKQLTKSKTESKAVVGKLFKAQSPTHKAELVLRANDDTFIQVKTDGKIVFAMTMQKGTMERWAANEEIILSGKNLYQLDMEINGTHIGSLGTIERKAHRVVITKDGLSVKK